MLHLVVNRSGLVVVEEARDGLALMGEGTLELGTHLVILVCRGSSLLPREQQLVVMQSPSGNLKDTWGACFQRVCVAFATL